MQINVSSVLCFFILISDGPVDYWHTEVEGEAQLFWFYIKSIVKQTSLNLIADCFDDYSTATMIKSTEILSMLISEPGIHRRNEDSRGNENRKSWEKNIFRGVKSRQAYFF